MRQRVYQTGLAMSLLIGLIAGMGCRSPLETKPVKPVTISFPVDVVLTRENQGWGHFTPEDYYDPSTSSRFEVFVKARYNKPGNSPGLYCWLRINWADSLGNFDYDFSEWDYILAPFNADSCPAPIHGSDTAALNYLGAANWVHTLVGGSGTGYGINIGFASWIDFSYADGACAGDTLVAANDTVHITEVIYKVYARSYGDQWGN